MDSFKTSLQHTLEIMLAAGFPTKLLGAALEASFCKERSFLQVKLIRIERTNTRRLLHLLQLFHIHDCGCLTSVGKAEVGKFEGEEMEFFSRAEFVSTLFLRSDWQWMREAKTMAGKTYN